MKMETSRKWRELDGKRKKQTDTRRLCHASAACDLPEAGVHTPEKMERSYDLQRR